jgi:hypothetical protein
MQLLPLPSDRQTAFHMVQPMLYILLPVFGFLCVERNYISIIPTVLSLEENYKAQIYLTMRYQLQR